MVRVDLEGGCPLHEVLSDTQELEALGRELADLLGVLDVVVRADGVHAAIDVVAHLGREDVLGVALRIVRALRSGDLTLEDIELEWADAADSAPDRLASILDGAEEELVALLLDPDAGA
jgi:exonuclease VII small subunit